MGRTTKTMRALAGWVFGAAVAGMLLGTGAARAQSTGSTVAGPFTIALPSAQMFSFATNFKAPPPIEGSYLLRVQLSAANSLTALSLKLNNTQVLALSDFAGGVTTANEVATLLASNSIAVQVAGKKGTKITVTVFTLLMPKPTALNPGPLALNVGAVGTLTATLSPVPTASGTLNVTSSNSGVATVPASVSFASGQTSVLIQVSAVGPGSSTITVSANGGQATATVNVNAPPTVSITAPAANAVYSAPAAVTVSASAADPDGTVAKVDFFDGGTLVGTATAAPYSVALANLAAGTHTFTAKATDNLGAATTSAAVAIRVDAPPAVSLNANNAVYAAPGNVILTATATDAVGSVAKIDFYQGTTLIGTVTAAPYTFNWTNVPAGAYSLTAVATNDAGTATTSAALSITVDAPPAVNLTAPSNNAVFAEPASVALAATASDASGTITKVDFYQGTTLIGTATASPYTFNWIGVAAGSYSLTAVATNDAGTVTTSAPIAITVDAAPSVTISSPANGASFTAPANIPVTASASETFGTIAKVDFYQGTTLIVTVNTAPYSFTWTNVPVGSYSLTAVATNDAGSTATSAAIAITVKSGVAQMYFIQTDQLNTPRLIADGTGTTVWRWDQGEPFGNDVPNNNPSGAGAFDFPLRFPGQYFDRETNVAYNMMRDYDPAIGRYAESDPIGLKGGLNTYVYVNSKVLRLTDPMGLVNWTGTFGGATYADPVGGGLYIFSLDSECKCHRRVHIEGVAMVGGVGMGPRAYGGTVGGSKFYDYQDCPNSSIADGGFATVSAASVWGGGSGCSRTTLGHLYTGWTCFDKLYGYDFSISAFVGISHTTAHSEHCC